MADGDGIFTRLGRLLDKDVDSFKAGVREGMKAEFDTTAQMGAGVAAGVRDSIKTEFDAAHRIGDAIAHGLLNGVDSHYHGGETVHGDPKAPVTPPVAKAQQKLL